MANYAHITDAHKGGNYSRLWLFFKERNDAKATIYILGQVKAKKGG